MSLNDSTNRLTDISINGNTLDVVSSSAALRPPTPLIETRIHRVVLTGGPCAGKTTCINRIKNLFENIGWKVLVVPETATHLLSSGFSYYDLKGKARIDFQENLLKTLIQIENTINDVANYYNSVKNLNVIVIYDRGSMDPIAYCSVDEWNTLKKRNPSWNEAELRDNRYDQIIHLVTAANGAEQFYSLESNFTRTETLEMARDIDARLSKAWLGHPCMDIIDNFINFETKVTKSIQAIIDRIGLHVRGFDAGNKKRKFLIKRMPNEESFPTYKELRLVQNYLVCNLAYCHPRIRKTGQNNEFSYSYGIRTYEGDQQIEKRTQINTAQYAILSNTIDKTHLTIYLRRRCFLWNNRYYRLDIFEEPCNPCCKGLIILSTRSAEDTEENLVPDFIDIEKEVTNDPNYSMINLSKIK